jgi:signal transduction histidine kinase
MEASIMKKIAAIVIFLFPLFAFFIANTCIAQEIVISKNTQLPYNLSSEVSIFEDATAQLSFEQIRKQPFKKSEKNWVLLPFSNQATWLKIDLKNESYQDTTFYLFLDNQLVKRTTLYINNQADSLVFEPFKDKGFSNLKYPHFPIKLKPNERQSYYLKFESKRGAYFKLQLYNAKSFEGLNDSYKLRLGLIIGLTWMILFIVCIIGFLVIKDNKSRAYAIYTLARAFSFWASLNILGDFIGTDPTVSEKITFAFMNISPIMCAFLALNILPFGSLPRWVKYIIYGFIVINLLLLVLLLVAYDPVFLKLLVVLNLISHSFFYTVYIYTLIKKTNQYPFYAIPFLFGNISNTLLNLRVSGILQFENIYAIAIFVALTEIAVYVYYLSQNFRASVKIQAEKLQNLGFEAAKATKLEELDKLKTRFFTNISHEFRTPLTLLVGPIEDLQKKYPQEGIIAVMQRNLQRLQTLINQILDLSKLEAGEMKANLQEVNLTHFFNHLFASFESLAQSKQIIFNHSLPQTPQLALFDTDKLEKIVTNLLSNAFKFTTENGRVTVKITTAAQPRSPIGGLGAFLSITVQDSGIGIDAARLPHVFDRFYQVEEHNNHEGTGIGLALVKELVELLGGTIEVVSQKGKGTTFTLTLPFVPLEKLSNPVASVERKMSISESTSIANSIPTSEIT